MHRHQNEGRKFGRERDQRRALLKGLATSLVEYGSIETTLPKAKEIVPYLEALITKAKKGSLHDRRQIIANLSTISAAHKLVDVIAPKLGGRTSGHLRIKHGRLRTGDNAQLAVVSFVDNIAVAAQEAPVEKPKVAKVAAKATKAEGK